MYALLLNQIIASKGCVARAPFLNRQLYKKCNEWAGGQAGRRAGDITLVETIGGVVIRIIITIEITVPRVGPVRSRILLCIIV